MVGITRLYIEPRPELPEQMRADYPSVMDVSREEARAKATLIRRQGFDVIAVDL